MSTGNVNVKCLLNVFSFELVFFLAFIINQSIEMFICFFSVDVAIYIFEIYNADNKAVGKPKNKLTKKQIYRLFHVDVLCSNDVSSLMSSRWRTNTGNNSSSQNLCANCFRHSLILTNSEKTNNISICSVFRENTNTNKQSNEC